MKDSKDLFIGGNINKKLKQKKQMPTIVKDFLLMLLLKELIDCLFLLLTILIMVIKKIERDSHRKYFLPRVDITKYNVLINGKNFYGWFQWHFRYWLGGRSVDDKRQINRWKKVVTILANKAN